MRAACLVVALTALVTAQEPSRARAAPKTAAGENAHYTVDFLKPPPGEVLEIGGMGFLSDGRLVLSTRRGRVWIVSDPCAPDPAAPRFELFADGLHEGLGLKVSGDQVYVLQRGELSRLVDGDGDGRAERVETISTDWGMTGNYHEFAYGLPRDAAGNFYVSLNLGFWNPKWWHGRAREPGRGWVLRIAPDGRATPFATGFRSPNGLELSPEGDLFVTDNQGDWMPTGPLYHVRQGGFYGHPASLEWTAAYRSAGRHASDTQPVEWERERAAVWLPYDLARSGAGLAWDRTGGRFGPFEGQLFVAELTNGLLVRVSLEKVRGNWQGACMLFRRGVGCANRVAFAPDGTLFAGLTERGWGGAGRPWGISRVRYSGRVPFEMRDVKLLDGGFRVSFTQPLAGDVQPSQVRLEQYHYNWWWKYGSPEVGKSSVPVTAVSVAEDRRSIAIHAPAIEAGRIARVVLSGVTGPGGVPLLHPRFDYTVNELVSGPPATRRVARAVPPPPTREQEQEGWLTISDGWTLEDWTGTGWMAGNVRLKKPEDASFGITKGPQTYVNPRPHDASTTDLASRFEHGDMRLALEFSLPRGGDAGVALMGRYALVLKECHGTTDPGAFTCGMLPPGQSDEGVTAARRPPVNACLKPGEWQKLELEFVAPVLSPGGRKQSSARLKNVKLNDQLLFADVELPGVSAGAPFAAEGPRGPFVLLGRRGQAAWRGVRIQLADWKGEDAGWQPVAHWNDLAAWKPAGWAQWILEEGAIRGSGRRGYLFSPALFEADAARRVELRAMVRLGPGAEGAMILGGRFDDRDPGGIRLPLNCDGKSPLRTGSLQGVREVRSHLLAPNVWFRLRVVAEDLVGGRLRLSLGLNGAVVAEGEVAGSLKDLQHLVLEQGRPGTRIWVRDLAVRER